MARLLRRCSRVFTRNGFAMMLNSSTQACCIARGPCSTRLTSMETRTPSWTSSIPVRETSPGGSITTRAPFFRRKMLSTSNRTKAAASSMIQPSGRAPVLSPPLPSSVSASIPRQSPNWCVGLTLLTARCIKMQRPRLR